MHISHNSLDLNRQTPGFGDSAGDRQPREGGRRGRGPEQSGDRNGVGFGHSRRCVTLTWQTSVWTLVLACGSCLWMFACARTGKVERAGVVL